ncbi:MAG: hypothetical protein MUE74_10035 [Bacteroidales bacterium]|nr:hypothetical protein [Bacteroidales bacterium]
MEKRSGFHLSRYAVYLLILLPSLAGMKASSQNNIPQVLFDFENKFKTRDAVLTDSRVSLLNEKGNHLLKVTLGHTDNRPSIKLSMEPKNLSEYKGIAMEIRNLGTKGIGVQAQCSAGTGRGGSQSMVWVEPGQTDTLLILFSRSAPGLEYADKYITGMNGMPGGYLKGRLDVTAISGIEVFKHKSAEDYSFTIDNVRAVGKFGFPSEEKLKSGFFPFVDKFGQYIYGTWPGKISSADDIMKQKEEETRDLADNPGPSEWDQYGGWKAGPKLTATGHFRAEKYQGKWWLVDPDGYLFWSQGIDCIRFTETTMVKGRENYFSEIPANGDFARANLMLKYGNTWDASPRDAVADVVHKRLRSWGINTVANWSDTYFYGKKRTPYTATLSSGIPKSMPTSLDENTFRATCAARLAQGNIAATKDDPWCIGYFVDNELGWPSSNAEQVIETYYRVVKEELKKLAPDKLFLGSRINNNNMVALAAASRYTDVVSINRYSYNVSDFTMPDGIDRPIIIGEFHFGALDRGLFHTGLRVVANQKQRALIYSNYVNQAIEDPRFVGAHWFQYQDQPVTGRFDGENYQIGFVNIVDRPYPEMISAARKIAAGMYNIRLNGNKTPGQTQ